MVICTYFLNNNCRFGNRCVNEHLNVRLTLKTDAETTLIGKQWPLSSYGPFRDKPCIQDFIEDQSFEEVRFLCYEAKATGNVQAVTQQFTERVNDARNKMALLTNPSEDIVKMVTTLYNNNCTGSSTTSNNMAANQNIGSNPFGISSNSNTLNAANIFGGSTATGTPAGNTNLFGSSSATSSNPFSKSTSTFGLAPSAQIQPSTNLFGGSNGAFGNTTTTAPTTTLFGGASFSSNSNSGGGGGGSMFGGAPSTSSVFGATAAAAAAAPGPFSQAANSSQFALPQAANTSSMGHGGSSLFQNNTQNATFGGAPTFGAPKSGLFAQANASLGPQSTVAGQNIFGQNVQPQSFGSMNTAASNQNQSSIFGAQNPVQSNTFGANGSIFGGNDQQQTQQQSPSSLFQNNPNAFGSLNTFSNPNQTQTAQSIFGTGNTQSMIGFNNQTSIDPLAQTMQKSASSQPPHQSIFGSSSFANSAPAAAYQSNSSATLFSKSHEQPAQPQQNAQLIFGQAAQTQFLASAQPTSTMFTPMDALSVAEIEAFRSNAFDITKIPTKPPPMELCR